MRKLIVPLLFAAACSAAALAQEKEDQSAPYQRAVDSVVIVWSFDRNWDLSTGTGVVIDGDHILTAYHVIAGGPSEIDLPERTKGGDLVTDKGFYMNRPGMQCRIVAADPKRDLALLRIKREKPPAMKALSMAAKSASPGSAVFTIGNDIGGSLFHYSGGNVRQVYQDRWRFTRSGQQVEARTVEMTVPINPGDSGGPILNQKGELVGINSAMVTSATQVQKGIDITEIRAFLDEYRTRLAPPPPKPPPGAVNSTGNPR
jgi:serine protease Do